MGEHGRPVGVLKCVFTQLHALHVPTLRLKTSYNTAVLPRWSTPTITTPFPNYPIFPVPYPLGPCLICGECSRNRVLGEEYAKFAGRPCEFRHGPPSRWMRGMRGPTVESCTREDTDTIPAHHHIHQIPPRSLYIFRGREVVLPNDGDDQISRGFRSMGLKGRHHRRTSMTAKATHPPIHAHRLTFQPRHREIIKMMHFYDLWPLSLLYFCCKQQSTVILYSPPFVVHQAI
ncbi:hypothetical protein BC826DRAFT_1043858 [Russula brevipes]|nr:hypothetical protein BC826DRAFT_1043858 [Russula brevipes]